MTASEKDSTPLSLRLGGRLLTVSTPIGTPPRSGEDPTHGAGATTGSLAPGAGCGGWEAAKSRERMRPTDEAAPTRASAALTTSSRLSVLAKLEWTAAANGPRRGPGTARKARAASPCWMSATNPGSSRWRDGVPARLRSLPDAYFQYVECYRS